MGRAKVSGAELRFAKVRGAKLLLAKYVVIGQNEILARMDCPKRPGPKCFWAEKRCSHITLQIITVRLQTN